VTADRPKRLGAGGAARWACPVLLALALGAATPAHAVEDAWAPGTGWLSLRAGYAKMASETAPNGAAGYGFGYSRMLQPIWVFSNFSLGAYAHHELLGRFAGAAVVHVPMSVELQRHTMWDGGLRPYFGLGYGANFVKGYRFPDSPGDVRGGIYFVTGFNSQLNANSVIGMDTRAGILSDLDETYIWSIKLNYAWVY
jgi:hypothetical protein